MRLAVPGFSVLAGCLALGAAAHAAELRYGSPFPPNHIMQKHMMEPWAKEIEAQSKGTLKITFHPGGELGSGPQMYKRVMDGVADMGISLQGFTSDQFPRTLLIELPGLAKDNQTAARMLYRAYDLIKQDYERTKVLALWSTGPNTFMMRKDPVRGIDDLKGKRLRTPSAFLGEIIKAIGASPVSMPINDLYHALQTGVLDGAGTGTGALEGFKLGEVIKYYTDYTVGVSPLFIVMNPRSYDRLSPEHRALIDKNTGLELSLKGAKVYDDESIRQLDAELKAGRGELHKMSPAEQKRLDDAIAPVSEKLIADREAKGIPARKIVETMKGGA